MAHRAPRKTAEQWAEYVTEFTHSNESVQAFCARRKLGFSTFNKWRYRLSEPLAPVTAPATGGFVEVVASAQSDTVISLHISPSIRLDLPDTLGIDTIAQLTQAVHSRVGG